MYETALVFYLSKLCVFCHFFKLLNLGELSTQLGSKMKLWDGDPWDHLQSSHRKVMIHRLFWGILPTY